MEERKETFHVRASVNNIRWGVIEWLQKRNYKRRDNKETFDNQSEGVIDRSYLLNDLRAEDTSACVLSRIFRLEEEQEEVEASKERRGLREQEEGE